MDGIVAYILSKKFTKDTVIGMGAIKGAACQVQSINKVGKTTTITLKWEDNLGGVHTQSFDIKDGVDVTNAEVTANGHLSLTLSDGTVIDCGKVLPQYDTMPTPSSTYEGAIFQYIGNTTSTYTKGYFYECINDGGVYKWINTNVQDSYTKTEIGALSDLPDNTKNVVQNINQLKLSIDQLGASKLSISDIDNALSDTSENPVQNKVITLALEQLEASKLSINDIDNELSTISENPVQNKVITGALNDKENKFRVTLMPLITADDVGKIVQYVGNSTMSLTKGYFYEATEVSAGVYDWVQKNVQPSGGGTGGDGVVDGYYNSTDHLFYEEATYINPISGDTNTLYVSLDTNLLYRYDSGNSIFIRVDESSSGENDVIDGYYNESDNKFYEEPTYTTEIIGETGKIYISDDTNIQYRWDGTQFVTISSSVEIDDELSTTSENPVQNKVITLAIEQLQASKLSISDIDDALSDVSENPVQNKVIKAALDDIDLLLASKVDKETGKGLSSNDFTDEEKEKLGKLQPIYLIGSGLNLDATTGELTASGIDVPIDDELSTTSINPVQNKVISLTIEQLQGSVLEKMQKRLAATADNFAIFDNNGEVDDSGISKNIVPSTASISNKLLVASDLSVKADKVNGAINDDIALLDGTGNLKDSNKKLSDLQPKLNEGNGIDINTTTNTISLDTSYLTASRLGFIPTTEKGSNNGVAELDNAGKVPSSQLPSYVDDVIEGYLDSGTFYEDSAHTIPITPESGKIYVDLTTNTTYRWSGTAYVQISESLALGTTHTTAYYGDYGQTAYNHSQIINGTNPHNTTADNVNLKVPITMLSGSKLQVEETLDALNDEKADKVASATNGHLAGLNASGNLTDSGVVANDVVQKSNTAGLIKNDGTIDTNTYLTATDITGKADLTDLAPTFSDTLAYKKGQYVTYNGDIYKFTADHAIGTWVGTDAIQVTFSSEIIGTTHNYDFDGVIPENSDLDDFTTLGNYSCAGTTAQTLANCPTTLAFSLEVSYRKDTPTYTTLPTVQQIIKNVNSTNSLIYYRTKVYNGSWTEWKSLATNKDLPYHKEISIVGSTTTTTYKNVYIKISGIPTANNSSTKAISLLLGTRSSRYILNINPYYNSNSLRVLQAIDLSRASDTPIAAKIVDLAYEFSDTTAVGTMDVWLKIYLNAYATKLNFSDISDITTISYNIESLGNDNDIYDVATSTTNGDYFDALTTKGIISVVSYGLDWIDAT